MTFQWVFDSCNFFRLLGAKPIMCNLLRIMIEAGFKISNGQFLPSLLFPFDHKWSLHDEDFVLFLIGNGISIDWFPRTQQGKENLRRLLSRDNDCKADS